MKWHTKKNLGLLGGLALSGILAFAPHAVHAGDGFYMGIFGGYNRLDDQDYKFYADDAALGIGLNPPASGDVITEVESDDDWMAGLTLGYASDVFRPELELTYRSNDVDSQHENYLVGVLGTPLRAEAPTKGDSTIGYSAMANLWIDFLKSRSNFHPYIGGGLGAVNFEQKDPTYAGEDLEEDDDVVMAYQLGGGLGYALTDQVDLSLDYRWLKSEKGKFDLSPDDSGTVKARYETESVMLTLRFYFDGPEDAPPPAAPPEPVVVVPVVEPAPPPPPPPPPPCRAPEPGQPFDMQGCQIGDTIVLRGVNFDFNKSSLTVNAKTILDQVAEGLNRRTDVKVQLEGHTDSKGSDAYNQSLSQRRAQSVMSYLRGKGIAADHMRAVGRGEAAPVADNETDEGRELNRRVEMKVLESSGGVLAP